MAYKKYTVDSLGGELMSSSDATPEYTARLLSIQGSWWKRAVDPYKRNIRRLEPGRVLDIGCGIGRNLIHLRGNGVGVDYNSASVRICLDRGLVAYEPDDFLRSKDAKLKSFDSMLLAHVAEHMRIEDCARLIEAYAPYIADSGKLIVITPQEVGQKSDSTHVTFMDFEAHRALYEACSFKLTKSYSFPFPRMIGKVFIYNEFVSVGIKQL